MTLSRKLRLACLMTLLVCTVGCDQASKHIARAGLSQGDSVRLPGGMVELKLADNPGAFLSLGAPLSDSARFNVFTLGVGISLVALFAYLTSRPRIDLTRFIGLSCVVAGGVSNFLDRIFRHGLVTDFITIHAGPFHTGVFNWADVLIMIGFGIMILTLRRRVSSDSPTSGIQRTSR
jgi:signal peptidase II